jgi:hypothetical protein
MPWARFIRAQLAVAVNRINHAASGIKIVIRRK